MPDFQESNLQYNYFGLLKIVPSFFLRICFTFVRLWLLRRSEKQKKSKLILSIVKKLVYIHTKQGSGLKKSNFGHFLMRKWPTKWLWPLYKWKKNRSDHRVHDIQIDRLVLTVSSLKSVLKNMHWVLKYRPKYVKFCWFGLEGRFWTVFW